MQQIFNLPADRVTIVLLIIAALVVGGSLVLAVLNGFLWRLATRNIARRRLRAGLIVGGLMLATLVIGTAFATGDAITYTLRSLVNSSLGTVDEVVITPPRRGRFSERITALTQPGLGTLTGANPDFFDIQDGQRVVAVAQGSRVIAAVIPAIIDQVKVVHPASQQLTSNVTLLAVPPYDSTAAGQLVDAAGRPIPLTELAADQVVLNQAAADALGATADEQLSIVRSDQTWQVQIKAVVRNGGVTGGEPLILAGLNRYQQLIGHANQINHLLIVNTGGVDSVTHSAEAALELRRALADRGVAQQLHDLLAQPAIQRGMQQAESRLSAAERAQLEALRLEAAQPVMSDRFISLVTEPRMRQRLMGLSRGLAAMGGGQNAITLLQGVAPLAVLEAKQVAIDQANQYGAVIATIFLVLGIFSIAAAMLLIFLIFALLAADRGAELATMRAIGLRRRQVMLLFLTEGGVYNVASALAGTLASAATGYLLVLALARTLRPLGIDLAVQIDPQRLVLALCAGVILTFGMMLFAAWRVSHSAIVAGIRGEAVEESPRGRAGSGIGLALVAGLVWYGGRGGRAAFASIHPLVTPLVLSCLLVAMTLLVVPLLPRRTARGWRVGDTTVVLAGLLAIAVWLRTLLLATEPGSDTRTSAITIAAGGVALIVLTIWTGIRGLRPALKLLDRLLGPWPRLQAIVRPAGGYLGERHGRTGLTVGMFGMVILTMVASLTLIDVAVRAYGGTTAPIAGFDLRADFPTSPAGGLQTALTTAPAVNRGMFGAVGGIASDQAQMVQFGQPSAIWEPIPLQIADDGFLQGIREHLERRGRGFATDADVWTALRTQPGSVVLTSASAGPLAGTLTAAPLDPVTIWATPNQGGRPAKLTVIGVVDARSELEAGMYLSTATASRLLDAVPAPVSYYLALQPGINPVNAADGLRISFADQGITVTDLESTYRIIRGVQLLLVRLVQGYMGLGLLAGIAALGLLGVQAVVERRQQLGTLRALGFTRAQASATVACESAVIAVLGIGMGLVLGLFLARILVVLLAGQYGLLHFGVPWGQIALTIALAWGGALLAILLAAWQAGRVAPAEALRIDD